MKLQHRNRTKIRQLLNQCGWTPQTQTAYNTNSLTINNTHFMTQIWHNISMDSIHKCKKHSQDTEDIQYTGDYLHLK